MIGLTVALTFVATVVVLGGLGFALSSGNKSVAGRLQEQWRPRQPQSAVRAGEKQKERIGRVLEKLGNVLPASKQTASRTRRLLTRAGYRRPEAAHILVGTKIALCIALLLLVYLSGLYRFSQSSLLFAGLLGFVLPDLWLQRHIRARQSKLRVGLADSLDLMVICVEAGLGMDQAILDRKSTRLNSSHSDRSRMPSSA